jgi:fatty-acyl-CoA synthase
MHGSGFMYSSLPTSSGGTVTLLTGRPFDAHELLRTVSATGTQVIAIVGDALAPPIVRALDEGPPAGGPTTRPTVRLICSAGVAWSERTKRACSSTCPR